MLDDFVRRRSRRGAVVNRDSVAELARNEMLVNINSFFKEFGKSNESYRIPMPNNTMAELDMSTCLEPINDSYGIGLT